jgi:hypothetical protein
VKESGNGKYCTAWKCEEYQYSTQTFDSGREFETYNCLASGASASDGGLSNQEASAGKYCARWTGSIEAREEFEVSYCQCIEVSGDYCTTWNCHEKGLDYFWPNMLWAIFVGILACIPLIVALLYFEASSAEFERVNGACKGLFATETFIVLGVFTFWTSPMSLIGVWKAGFGVLVITTLPLVVIMLFLLFRIHVRVWSVLFSHRTNKFGAGNGKHSIEATPEVVHSTEYYKEKPVFVEVRAIPINEVDIIASAPPEGDNCKL